MVGIDKRVIVKDNNESLNQTASGLFIPEVAKDGKVILTGEVQSSYLDCEVQKGDIVMYTKYAGVELIGPDGITYRVCKINDLLVKL